jgi:hypothetical protein
MNEWTEVLDGFLKINRYEILNNSGKTSHKKALEVSAKEFEKYRVIQDDFFLSDFDNELLNVKNFQIPKGFKKWTFNDLTDAENFYSVNIERNNIRFWGIDFKKKFSVEITKRIKSILIKNDLYNNDVCEFNEDIDIELLNLCYSIYKNQSQI